MATKTVPAVQCYFLKPTAAAPNNPLPVLIYRNVLPRPYSEESTTQFLTSNNWEKRLVTLAPSFLQFEFGFAILPVFRLNREYGVISLSDTSILTAMSATVREIGPRQFPSKGKLKPCFLSGIFQGSSTMILGQLTPADPGGLEVCLRAGDVIVLPAGTGHASLKSTNDYRYIGVYPENSPRWQNEVGDNAPETFLETIRQVGYPEADPVYGVDGPLVRIWQPPVLAKL